MQIWLLLILILSIYPLLYSLLIQGGGGQGSNSQPVNPDTMKNSNENEANQAEAQKGSTVRPIDKIEETNLRNCFPWSIYYLENIEYRPQAVLCRGKLRSNPDKAYKTIKGNVENLFGDRFFVLFQESLGGKPFFALVPNPHFQPSDRPRLVSLNRPTLALGLLLITLFTTTVVGLGVVGIPIKELLSDPSVLLRGLAYSLPLVFILSVHEMGHYLAAKFYQIRATLPYFIPVPPPIFPGTLGAFIQLRSPSPHRRALFDVGVAGPLAGFVATLPLLVWGLANSRVVPISENSGILNFESLNPRFSLLFTLLSKLALGNELGSNMAIALHPVAVAGYLGLIVTALNLMPVGQLDGGHIVHAMFGQRTGITIGQITRLLVLGLAFVHTELMLWAFILLFMPIVDEPALNDVSELDNKRDFLGLLTLALLVSILLPTPELISNALQL